MAGIVMNVLPRTRLNFDYVGAATGANVTGAIVQRIDTSQYREGRVIQSSQRLARS